MLAGLNVSVVLTSRMQSCSAGSGLLFKHQEGKLLQQGESVMREIITKASHAHDFAICWESFPLDASTGGSRHNDDDNIFHFCSTLCPKVSEYARDAN